MPILPTGVDLDNEARVLTIRWSEGEPTRHDYTTLRRFCPCATCTTERDKVKTMKGLRVLSGSGAPNLEPRIVKVEPLGRYAFRFDWDDGHGSGIYTYEFLRSQPQGPAEK